MPTGGCCPFSYYSASVCLKSPLNQSVFASEVLNVPWHLASSNYTMHVSVICSLLKPLPRAHVSGPFYKAPLEVKSKVRVFIGRTLLYLRSARYIHLALVAKEEKAQ